MFLSSKSGKSDQLFQMMTDKMLEAGCVKENYYEGISNREKEYPTGLLVNRQALRFRIQTLSE